MSAKNLFPPPFLVCSVPIPSSALGPPRSFSLPLRLAIINNAKSALRRNYVAGSFERR